MFSLNDKSGLVKVLREVWAVYSLQFGARFRDAGIKGCRDIGMLGYRDVGI